MLVLSRKKDESVMIGDKIRLLICDIRGDKVRLGIEAPRDVQVHREEIYRLIQREKGRPSATWSQRTSPDGESADAEESRESATAGV